MPNPLDAIKCEVNNAFVLLDCAMLSARGLPDCDAKTELLADLSETRRTIWRALRGVSDLKRRVQADCRTPAA